MRAIYIYFILSFFLINGCTTVKVAKEISKAGQSLKVSVDKIAQKKFNLNKEYIDKEKEEIEVSKKNSEELINKQIEVASINLMGKKLNQLITDFGKPSLIREEGNVKIVRFDTNNCRFFIFFDMRSDKSKSEYFELRYIDGNLIDKKNKIENCYKEIKKV
jgi:hypothetical protein|tara:strand:+ start:233 stop:715 length:483 start_codon:yes stop_codon:yes gene_type:complete